MWKTIVNWFLGLSIQLKIFTVIITAMGITILTLFIKLEWSQYQQLKRIKQELKTLTKERDSLNKIEEKSITDFGKTTTNAKNQSKNIDNKLKEDEKAIDNSVITDDELKDFLSKHGEGNN